ncbi:MAG: HEPN domain-containing protein [Anaerolineae bacterium]|nr:HEPN domain-containing protein [Anaerolineae bacterium]
MTHAQDEFGDAEELRLRGRFYLALFHFQQATEKALKAYLYSVVPSEEVFLTHSIYELLQRAEEQSSRDELIEELTLLLIYLCSWGEHPLPGITIRRAWKGYLFEVLDALEEKGLIEQSRRAKSLTLTDAGVLRAQEIEERYTRRS